MTGLDEPVFCIDCGRELSQRRRESMDPAWPRCAACARQAGEPDAESDESNDFEDLVMIDLLDGELDGDIF